MATVTITINDGEKIEKVRTSTKSKFPIPADPDTGAPLHTDLQWVKIVLLNYLKDIDEDYQKAQLVDAARNTAVRDDDLAS